MTPEHHMKLLTGMALLMAASAGVAGAAVPGEGPDRVAVKTVTLHYDANRIQDRNSAERLFFRIRQAAEEVCRIASYPRGYEMWDEHACEVETVAFAVRDVGLPALNRYYYRGPIPALVARR
jgi:UrcA family protein